MLPESAFFLPQEMRATVDVIRGFDPAVVAPWRHIIKGRRLLITGEGSSRIFPAKNAVSLALQRGYPQAVITEGARQAAEYDLRDAAVIAVSNSGRTREVIGFCESLKGRGNPLLAITAAAGSPLEALAQQTRILSCGTEQAVAATKTVVEQALLVQALLDDTMEKGLAGAAADCAAVLDMQIPPALLAAVAEAPLLYFAGRNDGVAEELTLKTNEITRQKSDYLEGTYALHGIEEVMRPGETLVLIEPFAQEFEKFQSVLQRGAGINIIALSAAETPFPTLRLPRRTGFDGYIRLMAGWKLLAAAGLARGVNIDKPERVRKVGNAI